MCQQRHPLHAVAIEELSKEASNSWLLEEVAVNQVNHLT
jgi:hypothetical protein